MVENTKIEWADHTFNPWLGCEKVSPACDHCYAESWARRIGKPHLWSGQRERTSIANWRKPMQWSQQAVNEGRRYRVFCASLADVFDNAVPAEWRADLFALIRRTPALDWLLLTKRIGNAQRMMAPFVDVTDPLAMRAWPNVWLGATVVSQEEAERDIPKLLQFEGKVRFLSIEPMLGHVDLRQLHIGEHITLNALTGFYATAGQATKFLPTTIDWVIAGGESGAHARPISQPWLRSLRDQCAATRTAFFFKQWGEWISAREASATYPEPQPRMFPFPDSADVALRIGKAAAGAMLDGRLHRAFPS